MKQKQNRPVILIVDDVPENLDILKGALASSYTIRPATSGRVALRAAKVHPQPDLVLLDIMMPVMDGYEVCQALKADPVTRDIPVIFITAKTEEADEIKGLNHGAVDYITKPFSIPIVKARVRSHVALREASLKLDAHNQRLVQERELIEKIVLKMRGADMLDERHLRHLVSPVEKTAGDMLLSTFTPAGRQLVLLGDFTGHGLPAAIGGPLVTYILHELAQAERTGEEIMVAINRQLCARLPVGLFLSVALFDIAPDRGTLKVWNAALPEALLLREGALQQRFASNMLPLGVVDQADMFGEATNLTVQPGDRFYAFSDGIIEASSPQGEMFGQARLEGFLTRMAQDGLSLKALLPQLDDHAGASQHDDDITLVEITV